MAMIVINVGSAFNPNCRSAARASAAARANPASCSVSGVCVDLHVHRIANRLRWVSSKVGHGVFCVMFKGNAARDVCGRSPQKQERNWRSGCPHPCGVQ
jgi:hypothetical protein